MKIVTYYNKKYSPIAEVTLPVMKHYGSLWKIPVVTRTYEVTTPPQWEKLNVVEEVLNEGNTAMWLDIDTVILNMQYNVRDLLNIFHYEMILNNGPGMFIVKPSALDIIQAWRTCGNYGSTPPHYDMPIFSTMADTFPEVNYRCLKIRSCVDRENTMWNNPFVAYGWTNADGVEMSAEYLKSMISK
jgi:hypothetical protein